MAGGIVALSALAMAVACALTPLTAMLARTVGAVDEPDARRVNLAPMPRIGGLAIFGALLCALALSPLLAPKLWAMSRQGGWQVLAVATVAIFSLGLIDDLRKLSAGSRLVCQLLAALAVSVAFVGKGLAGLDATLSGRLLEVALASLWLTTITNGSNLIDGLDGLSVGVAMIESAGLAAIAALSGQTPELMMLCLTGAALSGFWIYNRHPARVFLGDGGALLIGFLLAALALRVSSGEGGAIRIAVPLLMLAYPGLEVGLTVARRLLGAIELVSAAGQRPTLAVRRPQLFRPDRDHIHHRLLALGLSHRRAVEVCYLLSCYFVGLGMLAALRPSGLGVALGLAALGVGIMGRALGYHELRVFARGLLMPLRGSFAPRSPQARCAVDFLALLAAGFGTRLIVGGALPAGVIALCALAQTALIAWSAVERHDFSHPDAESCLKLIAVGIRCGLIFSLGALTVAEPRAALGGGLVNVYLATTWLVVAHLGWPVLERIHERSSSVPLGTGRTVIYGAGAAARMLIHGSPELTGRLLGLIDDDPALRLGRCDGVRIIGDFAQLEQLIAGGRVGEVIISTPKIEHRRRQRVAEACRRRQVKLSQLKIAFEPLPEAVVLAPRNGVAAGPPEPQQVLG